MINTIVTRTLLGATLGALTVGTLVACTTGPPSDAECQQIVTEHFAGYAMGTQTETIPAMLERTGCGERARINAEQSGRYNPLVDPALTAPTPQPAPTTIPAPTPTAAPTRAPATTTAAPRARSNADNSWACDKMGSHTVCEGNPPASVGEYLTVEQYRQQQAERESDAAIEACIDQTGMTAAQCRAEAAAGNAS